MLDSHPTRTAKGPIEYGRMKASRNMPDPLPELPGFTYITTADELESAMEIIPADERLALMNEKPLVMVNKQTRAVAILRPAADGSWNVEVFEPSA
jgi:hypothetical protein